MRLVKFIYKKIAGWGVAEEDRIRVLKSPPFSRIILSKQSVPLGKVRFLPPAEATKIVLVGLNYRDHARELKMKIPREPIIFLKPPTTLIGHKSRIAYPPGVKRLDYEAELAVVIKKEAKNVPEKKVKNYLLGYTCLNDVTARHIQKRDVQWSRAKSFDTFCPLGPWVQTRVGPSGLRIRSYLNGVIKQDSSTSNFIFRLNYLVSFISRVMTLLPGDVISTGTPPGVGPMRRKDKVEIEIEGIGKLVNYVGR